MKFALDGLTVIGIFAMVLGIWSQVHVGYNKIKRRAEDWQYSVVTLVSMFGMAFLWIVLLWRAEWPGISAAIQ